MTRHKSDVSHHQNSLPTGVLLLLPVDGEAHNIVRFVCGQVENCSAAVFNLLIGLGATLRQLPHDYEPIKLLAAST
jgi:hypothetical protein